MSVEFVNNMAQSAVVTFLDSKEHTELRAEAKISLSDHFLLLKVLVYWKIRGSIINRFG